MTDSFKVGPAPSFGPDLVKEIKKLKPNVFLVLMRSTNKNVVLYEANIVNGVFDKHNPVDVYWLELENTIENQYLQKRRSKGITNDRDELNYFEKNYGYGCDVTFINPKDLKLVLKCDPHPFRVKTTGLETKMFTVFDGTPYLLRSGYLEATKKINLLNLKSNMKDLTFNAINLKTKKSEKVTVNK
jgi:hypothetical protein